VDEFEIKEWYLWSCQSFPGLFNMSADHYLARQLGKKLDRPLLRFFTWKPFCISLGFHQKTDDLDLTRCQKDGLDVVRRPTGGRAILHARELTYSVVYPYGSLDVTSLYRLIHLPFVNALQQLGVPAEFKPSQTDFRKFYRSDQQAVCFATSAKYEVEIEGRKLIGSAQRVYENSVLQHGSLLLGDDHEKLVDYLDLPGEKKNLMREYIRQHTATVWQFVSGVTAESLAEKVREQFTRNFNIRFSPFEKQAILNEEYSTTEFRVTRQVRSP